MSDNGSSRLFDELNNQGVDLVVRLETAKLRLERDMAYDIAKDEMRQNMRDEIAQESRSRPDLRAL